jgi:ParB-like chromosome segregation protein Spo0J
VVSQVVLTEVLEPASEVVSLAVGDLVLSPSFREGGVCREHVERLVVAGGGWPPIVVSRHDRIVIDGAHRVAAARRLGLARIEAMLFDGDAEEAFVEFVRRNVTHGLLLTLAERKRAAQRVLRANPGWSDRRLAEVCGLSPKTIGRLRLDRTGCPTEDDARLDATVRIGRDDRARPLARASVRARVVDALREQPTASLRAIAAVVGVSPETVRLVRMNLGRELEAAAAAEAELAGYEPNDEVWRADEALASSDHGEDFLAWFERTALGASDVTRIDMVPLSRIYEIADEARRRSQMWLHFARALEARAAAKK